MVQADGQAMYDAKVAGGGPGRRALGPDRAGRRPSRPAPAQHGVHRAHHSRTALRRLRALPAAGCPRCCVVDPASRSSVRRTTARASSRRSRPPATPISCSSTPAVAGLDGALLARLARHRAARPHRRAVGHGARSLGAARRWSGCVRAQVRVVRRSLRGPREGPSRCSCPACSWSGRPGRAGRAGADRDRPHSTRPAPRDAGLERQ